MQQKTRFITITLLLLFAGFASTSIVSYLVANKALNHHLRTDTLPLTSDTIYSEIQRDLLQPILVSSLMAQDTFVRDWALQGEQNVSEIVRYLKTIQDRYQTITAFFVSDKTHRYYHSSGLLKTVSPEDAQDAWYFRINGLGGEFEVNMDVDTANPKRTTLFVNHKVFDFDHQYLGAIGVGLSSEAIGTMIERYQRNYQRTVYFVDAAGQVTLKGKSYSGPLDIHEEPGLAEIAAELLSSPAGAFSYQKAGTTVFLNTRFVPELNWYIVVEQGGHQESDIRLVLWINLALSLLVTGAVVLLAHFTLGAYQRRLEQKANTDQLTGAVSRHGLEPILENRLRLANRNQQAFSVVLVDIDHFKKINDEYGHMLGDQALVVMANLLMDQTRNSDVVCRWGGEEFLLLLPESSQTQATKLAEKLRTAIANSMQMLAGKTLNVTASFGVAEYSGKESIDSLFSRCDDALYRAKKGGRNKVCTSTAAL